MKSLAVLLVLATGCDSGIGGVGAGGGLDGSGGGGMDGSGGGGMDGPAAGDDGGAGDLSPADFATQDLSHALDLTVADSSVADSSVTDSSVTDSSVADAAAIDLATLHDLAPAPDLVSAPDLASARPPCKNGPGFAAFRFHYSPGSTSPLIDAFGLPDSSNFEAVPVFSTSVVDPGNGGGLEIASGNWLLIRYSVVGLTQINAATFSIFGRSYSVSASGSFDAWSPLYGDDSTAVNAISNAWPYAWTSVDYTGHVQIGDTPGLTGIRLYSGPGSDDLVIHTVELCIDGY